MVSSVIIGLPPSHHPFWTSILHEMNHPAMGVYPHDFGESHRCFLRPSGMACFPIGDGLPLLQGGPETKKKKHVFDPRAWVDLKIWGRTKKSCIILILHHSSRELSGHLGVLPQFLEKDM